MEKLYQLPFLTREMLRYEEGSQLSLVVRHRSFVSLSFTVRGATRNGAFSFKVDATGNANEQTSIVGVDDIPIWVSITTSPTIVTRNSIYVTLGLGVNSDIAYHLCSGYIFDSKSLSWPSASIGDPQPSQYGFVTTIFDPAPAAGSNWSYSIPAYQMYKIRGISFTLTTSATVANRRVHINFNTPQGGDFKLISSVDHAASLARVYTIFPMSSPGVFSSDNDIFIPMPDNLFLETDTTISSEVVNLQAGDQFSIVNIWVEKWFGYAE